MAEQTDGAATPTLEELQAELEKVRDALKKANAESADRRKKLEAIENSGGTEAEKLAKELASERALRESLASELKSHKIRAAIIAKASALQFEHPDDALALTDLSAVEITDDGKVTGFEKALESLAKSNRLPMKSTQAGTPGTPRQPGKQSQVQVEPEKIKIKL